MSETYEEIVRRNEPKNYTVHWKIADGSKKSAYWFTSLEEAQFFVDGLKAVDFVEDVIILRSGRHPTAPRWIATKRTNKKIQRTENGIQVNEDAWVLPAGYVDGDADKHGPVVLPSRINRVPARTNAEKAEWARTNYFEDRTCLWQ